MKTLLVLAGGFGTRLRSLVSDVPKSLAPVAEQPFLVHLIHHWLDQGVRDFVFLLHYEAKQIEAVLDRVVAENILLGVRFRIVKEHVPLGTGGSVLNAIDELGLQENFLVANADTWLETGVREISDQNDCAIAATWVENCGRYGALELKGDTIANFLEKSGSHSNTAAYINSGLYLLTPSVFRKFTPGMRFSLEKDVLPDLASSGQLCAVKVDGNFIDIGIPEDYLRFCRWVETGQKDEL